MNVQLIEAEERDLRVVRNLVRFYIYDMSESMGWECPENGRYDGCDDIPQYWGLHPDNPRYRWPPEWRGFPFLVRVDGRLAGFALVRRLGEADAGEGRPALHEIGEFFIVRKYRRKGVGREVAFSLFDRFPGDWDVREMRENLPAVAFWRRTIAAYSGGRFVETNEFSPLHCLHLVVQRFRSRPTGR